MKKQLILILFCGLLSAQTIFPPTTTTALPNPAKEVAKTLQEGVNAGLADRVMRMKRLWETLWENDLATPTEILRELGSQAKTLVLAANRARIDLEEMAKLCGTTAEVLLGNAKYLTVKQPITIHEDGTVTINQ